MSDFRNDGSVASANLPKRNDDFKLQTEKDSNTHLALVTKKYYTDDKENITKGRKKTKKSEVVYEVVIIGGELEGQVFSNVKLLEKLGSKYNYSEKGLKASTKPISGFGAKDLKDQDGSFVYINFISGNKNSPLIIGLAKHPQNEIESAAKTDGPIEKEEFNGLTKEIDKEGAVDFTQKGGTYNETSDEFEPNVELNQYLNNLSLDKDGKVNLNLGAGEEGEKPLSFQIDPSTESFIIEFKGGLKVTYSGTDDKYILETSGGPKIELDGSGKTAEMDVNGKKISIDDTKVELDIGSNKITVDSSGINLDGSLVNLGTGAAFSVTLFELLKAAYDTHTHMYIDTIIAVPTPKVTAPPTLPLLPTVGSTSVKSKT